MDDNTGSAEQAVPFVLEALRSVFTESLVATIVKGSVVVGDFISGYSDLDMHAFLEAPQLRSVLVPHREDVLRFQERIGLLAPRAFGCASFQVFFCSADAYPEGWLTPPTGTYRLVQGVVPTWFREPTAAECQRHSRRHLLGLEHRLQSLLIRLVDKPDAELPRLVRAIGKELKPALYSAAAVVSSNPLTVWRSRRDEVLRSFEAPLPFIEPSVKFFGTVTAWRAVELSADTARATVACGLLALDKIVQWHQEQSAAGMDAETR